MSMPLRPAAGARSARPFDDASGPADAVFGIADPPVAPRREVTVVFAGASTVAGYGDPKGQGWVGRVVARTVHPELDLTAYNLGVRGDTSGDLMNRWRAETEPRWRPGAERRLVVQIGAADVAAGLTLARSRLNLANILDEAISAGISCFVVGLPPSLDEQLNSRIVGLADAQADVCSRRNVTYVDCYRPLAAHDQWHTELSASPDGRHPGQAGYGLLAWLVLHNGWYDWMRISS